MLMLINNFLLFSCEHNYLLFITDTYVSVTFCARLSEYHLRSSLEGIFKLEIILVS